MLRAPSVPNKSQLCTYSFSLTLPTTCNKGKQPLLCLFQTPPTTSIITPPSFLFLWSSLWNEFKHQITVLPKAMDSNQNVLHNYSNYCCENLFHRSTQQLVKHEVSTLHRHHFKHFKSCSINLEQLNLSPA